MADDASSSGTSSGTLSAPKPGGRTPFTLYKPGQGTYVRWGTAIGLGVLVVAGVQFLFDQLYWLEVSPYPVLQIIIPVVVLIAMAYLTFWAVGRKRGTVDFMIATEGEMKKVNWSTRQEVIGATKVVIVTTLGMGALLFIADMICIFVFSAMKVIRIDLFSEMFGGGSN